ncbi:PREDICTED: cadherin-related family member 5 [Odobenus rosmarus divergens]|uniref:Cadherin-related family member 5 n=1 Tax=Odobenus rosmarus divergens TaxID=9708 RepID=A0A2U3W6N6_ODORO|nr:PREDICTED: cadherin-related family member 5 [Odobenus rosmarus divergens]
MGAWALLLPLLMAMAQGQVCSVNNTIFEVQENTNQSGPLADIYVPAGQQVTLGQSSTPYAFRIQGTQLFLNVTPDYEENTMLQAHLECRSGDTVVTQLRVLVFVLDINDNAPQFPFENKSKNMSEDTKVNTIVIPETELEAQDLDKDDILFYTLQEVTPGASNFFSLVGTNLPALRLDQPLDFYSWQKMTFQLLVRDTQEENAEPSHTAMATLDLHVWPADLRPPWFLPCGYSDPYVCINAEYHGAVPLGHKLPAPLVLRPGPIRAVDGDQGIGQRILYSIMQGNLPTNLAGQDGTFAINADSGNLTMTRSVPSPKTFTLLVKGEQADRARYSVTRVTIEARNATGSLPYFPKSRYYGQVARGSGAGVEVKDATAPSLPLRIWAQDPDFPDVNSAITYRITNNTNFRMDGETMLTTVLLANEMVFYAEVEANNTVTTDTATTVVEIQVLEWEEPSPTGPPETPTSPEAGGTTRPSSSTTLEAPRPPGPSQGPSTTSSGGGTGPHPPSSTTLRPLASSTPGGPPSVGTSTFLPSASPSGGSTQTLKPGTSQPMPPGPSRTPQTSEPPQTGGGSTPGHGEPSISRAEDRRFSVVDMAALGGVLGALLLLALIALLTLVHKHYGQSLKCCSGKAPDRQPLSFDNQAFVAPEEGNWAPAPRSSPGPTRAAAPEPPEPPEPAPPEPPSAAAARPASASPEVARDGGGPAAVRSILTKERRPEGGYKAVWFGEDIGAEADVVVLNTPASEAARAADSGSEVSSDGDADADRDDAAPGAGSTYV